MAEFRAVLVLGLMGALVLPGCAVGLMERDIALDRDLDAEDLAFIRDIKADSAAKQFKEAELEIRIGGRTVTNAGGDRGRHLWVFPVFARRKTVVVDGSMVAASAANEVPAVFPGLSLFFGLRHEAAASFSSADGTVLTRASFVEFNPLARVAVSKKNHTLRGWEFTLVKGLFGVGSSAYGPYIQFFWFLKFGEGADYSHQNQVKTTIRAIEPAAEPAQPKSRGSTGATGLPRGRSSRSRNGLLSYRGPNSGAFVVNGLLVCPSCHSPVRIIAFGCLIEVRNCRPRQTVAGGARATRMRV